MGQLIKNSTKYKFCFCSGLIIGIIIGAAALCVIVSYRLDIFYKDMIYLENTIEDKNERLEKLENAINTQNLIVEDIVVILIFEGDEMDKIEIEKSVKTKYITLLGKEVKNIDSDITVEVVDNRILKIEDREYKLHVSKLILTEVMKIWINIEVLSG